MTEITKEALYTLLLMNDKSNDLMFLPLDPQKKYSSRKELLQATLVQGKRDLEEAGLLADGRPTDEFSKLGLFLNYYAESSCHFQVDSNYYCAPGIGEYGRNAILIKKIGENKYIVDYMPSAAVMSIFLENHEILHNLEEKKKNYLRYDWQPYAYMRLMAYYGNAKTIRICTEQSGKITDDILFFTSENILYEYDLQVEKIRSVSVSDMKRIIIQNMRIKL